MASNYPTTVLYPEPLPDDTDENRDAAEIRFPPSTTVIRKTFNDLIDVPEDIAVTVNILMIYKLYVEERHIFRFPQLKAIIRLGVGVERIDISAATRYDITVHNTPDYGSSAVAAHAVTMATGLSQNLFGYHDELRGNGPIDWDPTATTKSLAPWDLVFGVLGRGRIGLQAAKMAAAFGYNVIYYDIRTFPVVDGISAVDSLEILLLRSHILSLHVPDTKDTRNIISAKEIDMLPRGAIIVNTARGRLLDLDAVEQALRSGRLYAVGLDVMPIEPPTDDNMPNLLRAYRAKEEWLAGRMIVTPHSASHSPMSFKNIHTMSATTANAVANGHRHYNEVFAEQPRV